MARASPVALAALPQMCYAPASFHDALHNRRRCPQGFHDAWPRRRTPTRSAVRVSDTFLTDPELL
jgi:hypothetical protein